MVRGFAFQNQQGPSCGAEDDQKVMLVSFFNSNEQFVASPTTDADFFSPMVGVNVVNSEPLPPPYTELFHASIFRLIIFLTSTALFHAVKLHGSLYSS